MAPSASKTRVNALMGRRRHKGGDGIAREDGRERPDASRADAVNALIRTAFALPLPEDPQPIEASRASRNLARKRKLAKRLLANCPMAFSQAWE